MVGRVYGEEGGKFVGRGEVVAAGEVWSGGLQVCTRPSLPV